jgi:hypothetical protein
MFTQSGDDFEHGFTMTDPTERDVRDRAIRAMIANPENLHQQVMAETELNLEYSHSPIIMGDANDDLAAGYRLPDTILVQWADGRSEMQSRGLHQLAHRAGHTLMLLAGPTADRPALVELHTALQDLAADSSLFEAAVALGSHPDLPVQIGQLQPAAADLLGIKGTTLLVVRPDGYVGLRSDQNHLGALENYRALVHGGQP